MAALNDDMDAGQGWVPLTEADAVAMAPGYYEIDAENVQVMGPHLTVPSQTQSPPNGRWVNRAIGGSTPASHEQGTALVEYFIDAPGGGGETPTLAEVLAEGNNTGGAEIIATGGGTAALALIPATEEDDLSAVLRALVDGSNYARVEPTVSGSRSEVEIAVEFVGASFALRLGRNGDGGYLTCEDLPTADPGVAGAFWIDTGAGRVLKVSAGA